MDTRYFECAYCTSLFASHQKRDKHQRQCAEDLFSEEFLITPPAAEKEAPTYKEMVERAAQQDPYYARYAGRLNIAEPNDMTLVLGAVIRKEKNDRRKAKEAQGLRSKPKESK